MANPTGKKHGYDFIWKRRQAVLAFYRRGLSAQKITNLLQDDFDTPTKKTIELDIKTIRKLLLDQATDLFGDQKTAVADYIGKTLDLRFKAMAAGDFRLAALLDKDLLKLVGVNLDRIEIAFDFGGKNSDRRPATFLEMINEVRSEKQLAPVTKDEL